MSTQHFAVVDFPDGRLDDPAYIFRVVREPHALSYEYYDRHADRWVFEAGLVMFTHNGEIGAQEIEAPVARAIIAKWRRWYN